MSSRKIFPAWCLIASLLLTSAVSAQSKDSGADDAWARLQILRSQFQTTADAAPIDWSALLVAAQQFQAQFPNAVQVRSAARLELTARLMLEEGQPALSADTAGQIAAYLKDTGNPARDRVALEFTVGEAGVRRMKEVTESAVMQTQAANARQLARDFPDQPDGYNFLLALAKMESISNARALAGEILRSNAPETTKAGALRVLARLNLVGNKLALSGAEAAIAAAAGGNLVVYSWTTNDLGFLDIIRRHAGDAGVAFIGVNLDPDKSAAQAIGDKLPGVQFYDGANLEGPMAQQLHLLFTTTLYVVGGAGVVQEINGHENPWLTLSKLANAKGERQ